MAIRMLVLLATFKLSAAMPDPNVNVNVDLDIGDFRRDIRPYEISDEAQENYVEPNKTCPPRWIPLGDNCYFFSQDWNVDDRKQQEAVDYCHQHDSKLATAGQNIASNTDPLLSYMYKKNMENVWLGGSKMGSAWYWNDGRWLSDDSILWYEGQPSSAATCLKYRHRYVSTANCTYWNYPFVCQRKPIYEEPENANSITMSTTG